MSNIDNGFRQYQIYNKNIELGLIASKEITHNTYSLHFLVTEIFL